MARVLTKDFSNMEISFVMSASGFICFNAMAIGKHLINGNINVFLLPLKNIQFILAIIYLGIFSFGYLFIYKLCFI